METDTQKQLSAADAYRMMHTEQNKNDLSEAQVLPRALGQGLKGNLRYAGPQQGWAGNTSVSSKKQDKPLKPLTDAEQELIAKIKQKQGNHGIGLGDLVPYGSPSQTKPIRAKIKRTLDNLVQRGEILKRTYKITGSEMTKYFVDSE
jgi:hypothetical protein